MASAVTRKLCTNSNECKQMAAAICEGCSQALCTNHFIEHRRFLGEEMNGIISEYDQFQHTLNQQTTNTDSHCLMKQIDEWENESISRIQQKTKELRQQVAQLTTVHLAEHLQKLRNLSKKLKEGQEYDNFVETDLQDWRESLNALKENLTSPSPFYIRRHESNPLVQNVSVTFNERSDLFERVSDNNGRIDENGLVAIHDTSYEYIEFRGKNEYVSGCHEIRLYIEQSADTWTFLGINSKSTPLQNDSYGTKSTYGWTNNNYVWSNGQPQLNTSNLRIDMKTNDIISLIFDCDNRRISMINQRTKAKYELDVNINYCPFPWQLRVILAEPNSHVRILSTLPYYISD